MLGPFWNKKKEYLTLVLAAASAISFATTATAGSVRVRGTITAVAPNALNVRTETGANVSIVLDGATAYLTSTPSDLNHLTPNSYIGVVSKGVDDRRVALDVIIFPASMRGAGEGFSTWDKRPDTTLSKGIRTASSMTNGSVTTVAPNPSSSNVDSTMTNGSIAAATRAGDIKQLTVTYNGAKQTILVPPTAPIVTLKPSVIADLKVGDAVFVNAAAEGSKTTGALIIVGSNGVAPPL